MEPANLNDFLGADFDGIAFTSRDAKEKLLQWFCAMINNFYMNNQFK